MGWRWDGGGTDAAAGSWEAVGWQSSVGEERVETAAPRNLLWRCLAAPGGWLLSRITSLCALLSHAASWLTTWVPLSS